MKRLTTILLSLLLIFAVALTACSSKDTEKAPDASQDETAGEADTTKPADDLSSDDADTETPEEPPEGSEQELLFVLHNVPDGIDPSVTANSFAIPFLANCFEGLVRIDGNNEVVPGLAEKWDISPDGTTYTFTLRQGLKWNDGSPLTSQDFMYAFQHVLTPDTAAQYVTMLTDYVVNAQEFYDGKVEFSEVGCKAPDENTFVITLKAPAPFYIQILTMPVYSPVQQATIEKHGKDWTLSPEAYICNGPFKITEMKMGESVTLVKNEHYWDADNVKLEKILYRYITDQSTALTAFQSDQIDGFRNVPNAEIMKLKAESDDIFTFPMFAHTFYVINCEKAPYNDARVRKALNLALDRQSLIDNVMHNAAKFASGLIPPGYSYDGKDYVEGRPSYDITANANVEEARKLLAEAGYPGGEGFPTMKLAYYTDPQVKLLAEAIAQMLTENLEINVDISTKEWAVYFDEIKAGDYEVSALGWTADYLHPMTFFPMYKTGDYTNYSRYSNPDYDELLAQIQSEVDPAKALVKMHEAEDLLMEDSPFLSLYYGSTTMMMKPYVKGWYLNALGTLSFRNAYIER